MGQKQQPGGEARMEVVQFLLDSKASPDHQTRFGETPLLEAVMAQSLPLVQVLLANGADVNHHHSRNGCNPLAMAIRENQVDIFNLLIQKGADVHFCTDSLQSPAVLAMEQGSLQMTQTLKHLGASFPPTFHSALKSSKETDAQQLIRFLIESAIENKDFSFQCSTDDRGHSLLDVAAGAGRMRIVTDLVSMGVRFSRSNVTALTSPRLPSALALKSSLMAGVHEQQLPRLLIITAAVLAALPKAIQRLCVDLLLWTWEEIENSGMLSVA